MEPRIPSHVAYKEGMSKAAVKVIFLGHDRDSSTSTRNRLTPTLVIVMERI